MAEQSLTHPLNPSALDRVKGIVGGYGIENDETLYATAGDLRALLSRIEQVEAENARLREDAPSGVIMSAEAFEELFGRTNQAEFLLALMAACAEEAPEGWLYHSDDGIEWSENHPVQSGEVSDARAIRRATNSELVAVLRDAWEAHSEAVQSEGRLRDRWSDERSQASLYRKALEFYRDNWDWYPGDGEQPNAVDVGSPPTFYEAEPNAALKADEGEVARQALSLTAGGEEDRASRSQPCGVAPSELTDPKSQHSDGGRDD